MTLPHNKHASQCVFQTEHTVVKGVVLSEESSACCKTRRPQMCATESSRCSQYEPRCYEKPNVTKKQTMLSLRQKRTRDILACQMNKCLSFQSKTEPCRKGSISSRPLELETQTTPKSQPFGTMKGPTIYEYTFIFSKQDWQTPAMAVSKVTE